MKEFNKYELNFFRAEAVKDVGEQIMNNIKWIENDIKNEEDELAEYRRRVAEGEEGCDWRIESCETTITRFKMRKAMWELAMNRIDEELMF